MEYVANLMSTEPDPTEWAKRRESEGWHVLGCADHLFSDRAWPHVWVSLTAMAAGTTHARITSSFANNLLRSPVEVAQAGLQLQRVAAGRFELGLGAGWAQAEIERSGMTYPAAGERAARYAEAFTIVRSLVRDGSCRFAGRHYTVDVPTIGPPVPVELTASVGGARTIREVAPLADRVEIKALSSATRGGVLDIGALRAVTPSQIITLSAAVRAANADAPQGLFVLCGVGDDARTQAVASALDGSFLGGFFGAAGKVADSVRALNDFGLSRVQLSPFDDSAWPALAAELL